MDTQLKKGLLEVCVLKVLLKEDSYGYKIIKDISQYIEVSESTLYPILKRLEKNGLLTIYTEEHNSRLRKYYRITEDGKNHIKDFLVEWNEVMKVYNFLKENIDDQE